MKSSSEHVTCDNCGGTTETRTVELLYPRRGVRYHISAVTAEVCPRCGNRYYAGPVVAELDRQIDAGVLEAPRSVA